jgi:hypothetical protein
MWDQRKNPQSIFYSPLLQSSPLFAPSCSPVVLRLTAAACPSCPSAHTLWQTAAVVCVSCAPADRRPVQSTAALSNPLSPLVQLARAPIADSRPAHASATHHRRWSNPCSHCRPLHAPARQRVLLPERLPLEKEGASMLSVWPVLLSCPTHRASISSTNVVITEEEQLSTAAPDLLHAES